MLQHLDATALVNHLICRTVVVFAANIFEITALWLCNWIIFCIKESKCLDVKAFNSAYLLKHCN